MEARIVEEKKVGRQKRARSLVEVDVVPEQQFYAGCVPEERNVLARHAEKDGCGGSVSLAATKKRSFSSAGVEDGLCVQSKNKNSRYKKSDLILDEGEVIVAKDFGKSGLANFLTEGAKSNTNGSNWCEIMRKRMAVMQAALNGPKSVEQHLVHSTFVNSSENSANVGERNTHHSKSSKASSGFTPRTPLNDVTNLVGLRGSNQFRSLQPGRHRLTGLSSYSASKSNMPENNTQVSEVTTPVVRNRNVSRKNSLDCNSSTPVFEEGGTSGSNRNVMLRRPHVPCGSRVVRELSSTFEGRFGSPDVANVKMLSSRMNVQPLVESANAGNTLSNHDNATSDEEIAYDDSEVSDDEFGETEVSTGNKGYFDVGDADHVCEFCGARFWLLERIRPKRKNDRPITNKCCSKGKVKVPLLPRPPEYLFKLMTDKEDVKAKHFQENIRAYNTMFSFTSMGGKVDGSINNGGGRYVFRLCGQNHHRIGSLIPPEGQNPRYAQLYIYDTHNEVDNRMQSLRSNGSANHQLDSEIVKNLQDMMYEHNRIAKVFKMARERLEGEDVSKLKVRLLRKRRKDSGVYSFPTCDEIAALVPGDVDADNGDRDIIVETQSGLLQRIHELHPLYIPMHYPVFLVYGEDGFIESTLHAEHTDPDNRKNGKMTLREYFAFRIQFRDGENAIILYGRRLFQQFVVDAYTMIEAWRLSYIRFNQKKLLQDLYKGLSDAVFQGERDGATVGKRIVLPSSFTGGPRYLMQNYQDAMAICKWAGYLDIFLTFTCNPKWPEFTRFTTAHGLKIEDRPDIVVRIFKMKLNVLMEDLKKGSIFGPLKAAIYTIEFQKRGLPHAHIILFLQPQYKNLHPEQIDSIISAEIPDEKEDPEMHALVKEFMVHGPCGAANPKAPCMVDGRCSKYSPKNFEAVTKVNEDGFPIYRRRDDGTLFEKGGVLLDNRSVVAHNKKLVRKHRSHINTEYCNQGRSIKYLFKYISKGNDRVTVALYHQSNSNSGTQVDEIKCYYDCRYISPCEAMWRIFGYEINHRKPAVERLKLHLPGEQSIVYKDDDDLESVVQNPANQTSMFMAWMDANQLYEQARDLCYLQFPSKFVYDKKAKCWRPRKKGLTIGRLIYIPPNAGELFYLSLLVNRVKGPTSYVEIRTVDGVEYNTFRDACYVLGLLEDDAEFIEAIEEAKVWGTGVQLRSLFVTMLLSCTLTRPEGVWEATWLYLCEDLVYPHRRLISGQNVHFSEAQIQALGLLEIDNYLRRVGKCLNDFPTMPQVDNDVSSTVTNTLIAEQLNFDKAELAAEFGRLYSCLNLEQIAAFTNIMEAVEQDKGGFFFLNGYGGTGKTFIWRALTAKLRSEGHIVLAVASSGITATLLPAACTAHSRFRIPIVVAEDSTCNIKKGTLLAELLLKCRLIIWDEAPMVKRHCFEALDRTLRDLMQEAKPESQHLPFAGKTVVLGGDFRQILPVIPGGKRSDIVYNTINSSKLWYNCKVLKLVRNMRLQMNGTANEIDELREFSQWLLDVGDGNVGHANDGEAEIEIPGELILTDYTDPMEAIFQVTYPNFDMQYSDPEYLKDRAVLTPTLEIVDEVNKFMMNKLPGQERTYLSADSTAHSEGQFDISARYVTTTMLNDLKFSGLPNHELTLKIGAPIMLLRNIDQAAGLCNGTRMIVTQLANHVIGAKVISGGTLGHEVFLSRMKMSPSDTNLPFRLQRTQFPITISYCMTINKSQGQSLSSVTVYLPRPVFSHGQLYVAISRVKSKKGLKFVILDKNRKPSTTTQNVVYKEVFDNVC